MFSSLLLSFDSDLTSATGIGAASGIPTAVIQRHRFPDGEVKLCLPDTLPSHVVLVCTLDHPNEKLLELMLTAATARRLGATHLTLIAPYLAYMRQDIAFTPGEAVSQRIVGRFLADYFDAVLTVDPHLHRVATLQEAVPVPHALVLSGAPLLADLIAQQCERPLLMGPDEESAQWIALAAARHGFDYAVCHKVRHGDHAVDVALPDVAVQGRSVVLLDDMASTGNTVARAAQQLLAAGAKTVDVAVTHALFADKAIDVITAAGVRHIWSTDCIPHATNAIPMAPTIGVALAEFFATTLPVAKP